MRKMHAAMLSGIATLGLAGAAAAATGDDHVLKVALPDGSIEQFHYSGDVAPKLVFVPQRAMTAPIDFMDSVDAAPFAMFDRVAAQMDQQRAAMMRQVAAMQALPTASDGAINAAAFGKLPAGTMQYSFVSTSSGNGTSCSRSMQVTSMGAGLKPKVISQSSGDCTPAAAPAVQGATPAERPLATTVNYHPAKDHAPSRTGPTI